MKTIQESSPSKPVKVKTFWTRVESLVSLFVLLLVVIGAWTTFSSIHELLSPVKSAQVDSNTQSEMLPVEQISSMIQAGYWRVKDYQWALAMRVLTQTQVSETLEQRKTHPRPMNGERQDIHQLTEAIKQHAPAQPLGGDRLFYENKSKVGHFSLITRKTGQQETLEFAMAAVPGGSSKDEWQVFEVIAPIAILNPERRHLLPLVESSLEVCSRVDLDGVPTLQILEVPEPLDLTLSRWTKAGWKLDQSIDLPFGQASYLCTRDGHLVMASVLNITADKHDLLLGQIPHPNSQEKNQ